MKRVVNFTNRRRIDKNKVEIAINESSDGAVPTFTAQLDFGELNLPRDARIVISSYRLSFAMRFDWGTVGEPIPPSDTRLTETPINPMFRVMVLSPDRSGRIYAMCDRIRPTRGEDGVKSLLWLDEVDNLEEQVWRLDIGDANPVVQVNRGIANISNDARSNGVFRALVIPEVLRNILKQALIEDNADPDGETGDWEDWMEFLGQLEVGPIPKSGADGHRDAEETGEWIDKWVNAFVNDRLRARELYVASRSGN